MRSRTSLAPWLLSALFFVGAGCHDRAVFGNDVGQEAGGDASGDGAGDSTEADTGDPGVPGALTFVVREAHAVADRLCDLDGDGVGDNAIADLGEPGASLIAAAVSAMLGSPIDGALKSIFHFPRVADVATASDPDTSLIFVTGIDADDPPEPANDFSGDGAFFGSLASLDECMEPHGGRYPTSLDHGVFAASGVIRLTPDSAEKALRLDGARLEGNIDTAAGVARMTICGYMSAAHIGSMSAGSFFGGEELSVLEVLLAGGDSIGIPGVPGIALDVDVDGDGLERILLGESGRVEHCVDGDRSEVPGADCWQDPRIADGISLVVRFEAVGARLAGLAPAAEIALHAGCDSRPPGPSAWAPCPDPAGEESCERLATRSCDDLCGREGIERCEWDCAGWASCVPLATEELAASSCDELLLEGATCDAETLETVLVSGPSEVGGLRLAEPVTVGRGPVVIDARARVARGASAEPGLGWAVIASLESPEPLLGDEGSLGVRSGTTGYAATWHFGDVLESSDTADFVFLLGLEPSRSTTSYFLQATDTGRGREPLDAGTVGTIEQRLRVVIEPDLPETDDDETAVGVFVIADGAVSMLDSGCLPGDCPVRVPTGSELAIAMTASTSAAKDARVAVELPEGLSVRSDAPCP